MGSQQSSGPTGPRQEGILSRDQDGAERLLHVADHPAGFITISDDQVARILTPSACAALVMELVSAMGTYLPVRPLSGRF